MFGRPRVVPKPILPVTSIVAAAGFYRSLGFEVEAYDDGYAWVREGGEEVFHLSAADDFDPSANRAALYLHVPDVDEWRDRCAPAHPTDPVDQPWGMREFSFRDPDGNLVRLGRNL